MSRQRDGIESYIKDKIKYRRFTDIYEFCKGNVYNDGFEQELQQIVEQIIGKSQNYNSWTVCVDELIGYCYEHKLYLEDL